jgi:hypothetical protein
MRPGRPEDATMIVSEDVDTILPRLALPAELGRAASSHHAGEEPRVASMISGLPLMIERNLLVPAHDGVMAQSAWRVD